MLLRAGRLGHLRSLLAPSRRGEACLLGVMSLHFLVCVYSSLAGVAQSVAFVRHGAPALPPLSGGAARVGSLFPATQSFGYFAPQVCSEFRAKVQLGESATRKVVALQFHLPPEAGQMLSTFNSSAQDEAPARAIAASYASYAFNANRSYDYALVTIEAESVPRLRSPNPLRRAWVPIRAYYFTR